MKKIIMMILLMIISNSYGVVFNDGYEHNIDYIIDDTVSIQNDSFWDYPTTVNLIANGNIMDTITVSDSSILNIYEGQCYSISGRDNSTLYIQSGIISWSFSLRDYSTLVIENGLFNISSSIIIKGYSILDIINGIFNFDEGKSLALEESSTVFIYGSDFFINGRPIQNNTIIVSPDYTTRISGLLTGTFIGGGVINMPFSVIHNSELHLLPEIEPYCTHYPTMDFNRDCKVNLIDFVEFVSQWMVCNLEPQSYCWEE